MATVQRKVFVNVPGYGEKEVIIEVDEDHEKRLAADPDADKLPVDVLKEVSAAAAECHPKTVDVAVLQVCVQRLSRLIARGIGTSPSEPTDPTK